MMSKFKYSIRTQGSIQKENNKHMFITVNKGKENSWKKNLEE